MIGFIPYVSELKALLAESLAGQSSPRVIAALNGEPARQLRSLVDNELLRETGTFFTSSALVQRLMLGLHGLDKTGAIDPACGVGDLLLGVARNLPVFRTFEKTIGLWSELLAGCDIHSEFVEATKLRLCLLAIQRGVDIPQTVINLDHIFQHIVCADGMFYSPGKNLGAVIMNPPYIRVPPPAECAWAGGRVSAASLFVDRWVNLLQNGQSLVAILPDVLRTGSNYRAWRECILGHSKIKSLDIIGRFDAHADVDVFAIEMISHSNVDSDSDDCWQWNLKIQGVTIGDKFSVKVGTVVPHRDPKSGPHRAYLHAKATPRWGIVRRIAEKVKTKRNVFFPPFVVIRRTSSPCDSERAVGTLVLGSRPVAVENHLIVLLPKHGKVGACKELMRVLKASNTTAWLNQRIRCRHLTVDAVRKIPWVSM